MGMAVKITIETDRSQSTPSYNIKVKDGKKLIKEQKASTVEERDNIVWGLAQTYNIKDVVFIEAKIKKATPMRLSELPMLSYHGEKCLSEFFDSNPHLIVYRILKAVEEGLYYNLQTINLVEIGESGAIIQSNRPNWLSGLKIAVKYFESIEDYEGCLIANTFINQLQNETTNTTISN